jgi:hypothetical protein
MSPDSNQSSTVQWMSGTASRLLEQPLDEIPLC